MAKSSFSETWEALILTVYLWRQVQAHKNYETKTQISERGLKEKFDTTSPGVTQYLSRSISLYSLRHKRKLTFVHLYPNISLPESRRWDSGVGLEVRDTPSLFFFPAHICLRRPHDLTAWNRLPKYWIKKDTPFFTPGLSVTHIQFSFLELIRNVTFFIQFGESDLGKEFLFFLSFLQLGRGM